METLLEKFNNYWKEKSEIRRDLQDSYEGPRLYLLPVTDHQTSHLFVEASADWKKKGGIFEFRKKHEQIFSQMLKKNDNKEVSNFLFLTIVQ